MKSRNTARAALALAAVLCVSGLAAADSADASSGKKVNINQASAKEISNLPRIGIKVAERIVEYRQAHGAFSRIEDLMEVKGVGDKLFTELKPYLALSGPTTLTEKVSSKGTRGGSAGKSTHNTASHNTASMGKGR